MSEDDVVRSWSQFTYGFILLSVTNTPKKFFPEYVDLS